MGILLPDQAYVKTIDTGETVLCGGFTLGSETELSNIRVILFKVGTLAGTEQLRARVYGDRAMTKLMHTSDWLNLSAIEDLTAMWWGWVRFDFERKPLDTVREYFLAIDTQGYTRNADTMFIGLSLDWPTRVNSGDQTAVKMEIYGYRGE